MSVYISAYALHHDDSAASKLITCIQSLRSLPESIVVMVALPNSNKKMRDGKLMVERMADIILNLNTPVTITNVGADSSPEKFCDLIRATKIVCATHDPYLKDAMALHRN